MPEEELRVLMLATYFPKPLNPLMGNWALTQAQALRRAGINLTVVSLTSWVPPALALTKGSIAYARCPKQYDWSGLRVLYPRWLYYQVGLSRKINRCYPRISAAVGWWTAKKKLLEIVKRTRPHLIYAHHTEVNGYLALQLKRCTGLPYIVTDWDFGEIESCRTYPGRKRLFKDVAREASAMVAEARRMELEMKDQFPFARTHTIPHGVDPPPQIALQEPRPYELQGRLVVFSCGTFYHRKGFPVLIDAFARVAELFPEATLRVAGDGAERRDVEERIRYHGLGGRVELLGVQPNSRVIQEMIWCDVFALIGWDEPFATVYVEALSVGKPVVCCFDGGIADVVKDGEHGFTVPPRDASAAAEALGRLLGDVELRRKCGNAAYELFQSSLSSDQHALRMKNLFADTLAANLR